MVALAASCMAGVLMSYSQFLLRGLISATSFTVVGTMCKIATVVINCLIWDKHASFEAGRCTFTPAALVDRMLIKFHQLLKLSDEPL